MDARLIAVRVLSRVLDDGRHLDSAFAEAAGGPDADRRERALARELCYGTLRWYFRYDYLLRRWLSRPLKSRDGDIRALILCGMYQLEHLRIPDHAAVAATVEAARRLHKPWATRLINAMLRRFQREAASLEATLSASPPAYYAHPRWLLDRLRAHWPEHWQGIVASNNRHPPMHLRVNLRRTARQAYLEELQRRGIAAGASSLAAGGVCLQQPLDVEFIPGFTDGLVSVQDFGAQLAAPLLDAGPGQRILDACAAPGGKTGHVAELAPPEAELVAVESDGERLARLRDNQERLGFNAKVVHSDIIQTDDWWDGVQFDRILVDIPCSATGVIRRHPDIKVLRTPGQVAKLAKLQEKIMGAVWPVLKPGGKLLYVTCSLLEEEGDGQIAGFVRQRPDAQACPIEADWGIPGSCGRWLIPGADDTDGFFYAVLEKSS